MKLSPRYNIFPIYFIAAVTLFSCNTKPNKLESKSNIISKSDLRDKIKGGWAGQTIGVVYGAPVEFKYQGSIIPERK